jgi:hypothetical protein
LETLDANVWEESNPVEVLQLDSLLSAAGSTQHNEVAAESPDQPPSPHISPLSIYNATPDMVTDVRSDASSPEQPSPLVENAVPHLDITDGEAYNAGDSQEVTLDDETACPLHPHKEMSQTRPILTEPKEAVLSPVNEATNDSPAGVDRSSVSPVGESQLPELELTTAVTVVPEKEADVSAPIASSGVPTNQRDLLAETASPAKVLRELRQLGMEKQSSIVIVSPRRASVLSMMMPPPSVTDADPLNDDDVSVVNTCCLPLLTYYSERRHQPHATYHQT